jgi:hypothetical protein
MRWLCGPGKRRQRRRGRRDRDWVSKAETRIRDLVLLCSSRNRWKEEKLREERHSARPSSWQSQSGFPKSSDMRQAKGGVTATRNRAGWRRPSGLKSLLIDFVLPSAALSQSPSFRQANIPVDKYTAYRRPERMSATEALQHRRQSSSPTGSSHVPFQYEQPQGPPAALHSNVFSDDTNSSTLGLSTTNVNNLGGRQARDRSNSAFSSTGTTLFHTVSRSPTDVAFDLKQKSPPPAPTTTTVMSSSSDLPYPEAALLRGQVSSGRPSFSTRRSEPAIGSEEQHDRLDDGDDEEDTEEHEAWLKYPSPSPSFSLRLARNHLIRQHPQHQMSLSDPSLPTFSSLAVDPDLIRPTIREEAVVPPSAVSPIIPAAPLLPRDDGDGDALAEEGGNLGLRLEDEDGLRSITEESGEDDGSSKRTSSIILGKMAAAISSSDKRVSSSSSSAELPSLATSTIRQDEGDNEDVGADGDDDDEEPRTPRPHSSLEGRRYVQQPFSSSSLPMAVNYDDLDSDDDLDDDYEYDDHVAGSRAKVIDGESRLSSVLDLSSSSSSASSAARDSSDYDEHHQHQRQ